MDVRKVVCALVEEHADDSDSLICELDRIFDLAESLLFESV